ncbi:MAG: ATP synthase F1 subunit epsilon [Bdellovibrionales bacterium]|nr:ATP synthase F1 subunit epsilon [Bdellovibrionales bacterium]
MFALTIVTPTKILVNGAEMEEVFVPAHRGELDIYPGHAPLLSTLTEGVLRYRLKDGGKEEAVAISWGYVEITPGGVQILAETAESKKDIDLQRAEDALSKAIEILENPNAQPEDVEKYHHKRRRAEARIAVSKDEFQ